MITCSWCFTRHPCVELASMKRVGFLLVQEQEKFPDCKTFLWNPLSLPAFLWFWRDFLQESKPMCRMSRGILVSTCYWVMMLCQSITATRCFLQWAICCCSSLCNCGLCISNIHDLTTFNMWSFSNLSASLTDIDLTIGWMVCANFNLWLFGEGINFQACWKAWSYALLIPSCMPYWMSTSTQAFEQVVIEVSKTLGELGYVHSPCQTAFNNADSINSVT